MPKRAKPVGGAPPEHTELSELDGYGLYMDTYKDYAVQCERPDHFVMHPHDEAFALTSEWHNELLRAVAQRVHTEVIIDEEGMPFVRAMVDIPEHTIVGVVGGEELNRYPPRHNRVVPRRQDFVVRLSMWERLVVVYTDPVKQKLPDQYTHMLVGSMIRPNTEPGEKPNCEIVNRIVYHEGEPYGAAYVRTNRTVASGETLVCMYYEPIGEESIPYGLVPCTNRKTYIEVKRGENHHLPSELFGLSYGYHCELIKHAEEARYTEIVYIDNRGRGLRATKLIPASTVVAFMGGKHVTDEDLETRADFGYHYTLTGSHVIVNSNPMVEYKTRTRIPEAYVLGGWINYMCNHQGPNCEMHYRNVRYNKKPYLAAYIVARRDITEGEELAFDYSPNDKEKDLHFEDQCKQCVVEGHTARRNKKRENKKRKNKKLI